MSARALTAAAALFALAACASPGIPPGGPPDKQAPQLLAVTPDTNSTNVKAKTVLFRFDEVVNERSSPTGGVAAGAGGGMGGSGGGFSSNSNASTLASLVLVSPGDGRERVSWRRTAIEVQPRNGFRPNTTYRVTILPGLGDLRGNVLKEPVELVFSTGSTPTTSAISGLVFDWVGNKIAPNARVEVFTGTDSTLRWSTRADSAGRFTVRDLAPGRYHLRGWLDANTNRMIDPREAFDSTSISVDSTVTTELYAFAHDTIGPRIETLETLDSTGVRIKFDRGVATDWSPTLTTIILTRSDSTVVPVGEMVPAARYDSLARAALAAADTAAQAATDSAANADTVGAAARAAARDATRPIPTRDDAGVADAAAAARAAADSISDSLKVRAPKLNRPIPILTWVVPFAAPLPPGEYRVTVRAIRGLSGAVRDSERVFRLRPPAAPKDSTAAPAPRGRTPDGRPAAAPPETQPPASRPPEPRRPRR